MADLTCINCGGELKGGGKILVDEIAQKQIGPFCASCWVSIERLLEGPEQDAAPQES